MPDDIFVCGDPEYQRLEDLVWKLASSGAQVDLDTLIPSDRSTFRPGLERVLRRAKLHWLPCFPTGQDPESPWACGQKIGEDYRVEEMLGRGGMGEVYLVRRISDGNAYAVKRTYRGKPAKSCGLLLPSRSTRALERNLFHELLVWMGLPFHPNVAQCKFFRLVDNDIAIFLEYVNGGSVDDWIRDGRLYTGAEVEQLRRILLISHQTARGLACIHRANVVHQDVKPRNVLMTSDLVAKISDFGISRAHGLSGRTSAEPAYDGVTRGGLDPSFCSPEQYQTDKVTSATDIWSWAATTLAMFCAGPMWASGPRVAEALNSGLACLRVPMPEPVLDLLKECLVVDETARLSSTELVEGLAGVCRDLFSGECLDIRESAQLAGETTVPSAVGHVRFADTADSRELYMDEEADRTLLELGSSDELLSVYLHKFGRLHQSADFDDAAALLDRMYELLKPEGSTRSARIRLGVAFLSLGQSLVNVRRLKRATKFLKRGIRLVGRQTTRYDVDNLLSDAQVALAAIARNCGPK